VLLYIFFYYLKKVVYKLLNIITKQSQE